MGLPDSSHPVPPGDTWRVDLRPSSRHPAPYGQPVVRRLVTADGVPISAAYDPPEATDGPCFVVAHGFTGAWSRPDSRRIASALRAYGAVVSIDLRGHGRSGGLTSLGDTEVHDVDAAVAYARWLGHERVVTVGFSLGGGVVLRQGAVGLGRAAPDAVVAVSAAAFWFYQGTAPMRLLHRAVYARAGRGVLRTAYGTRVRPLRWVTPYPDSPWQAAARIAPTPLLVVHGGADAYFPPLHPETVVAAARAGAAERGVADRTTYLLEPDFGHAEAAIRAELLARIGAWGREQASPIPHALLAESA